jgi:hypothetical protein
LQLHFTWGWQPARVLPRVVGVVVVDGSADGSPGAAEVELPGPPMSPEFRGRQVQKGQPYRSVVSTGMAVPLQRQSSYGGHVAVVGPAAVDEAAAVVVLSLSPPSLSFGIQEQRVHPASCNTYEGIAFGLHLHSRAQRQRGGLSVSP